MKFLLPLISLVAVSYAVKCGETPVAPKLKDCDQTRIVGGCEANAYSWPWQIGFVEHYFGSYSLICGGSIIDENWIMTAGHCVSGSEDKPGKFRIKAGVFDRANNDEDGEEILEIESIHLHPDFDMQTISWDISLLKLKKPLNFTGHVRPVCVPASDDGIIVAGDHAWVTGWGTVHEGDSGLPKNLHQVDVPYLNQSVCDTEYGQGAVNDKCMFCAGRTGVDSCQGDSGGPLVTQDTDGSWKQYGIVSWGRGCAESGYAGVYSRVSAYCDFIKKTVGKDICV
jgi:secreted trypsin-like serine protease